MQTNPKDKQEYKIARGGNWNSNRGGLIDSLCTPSHRMFFSNWDWKAAALGFRIVMGNRNDNKS